MPYVYAHYRKTDDIIFYVGIAKSNKRFLSKYSRNNLWENIVNKHDFYYKILFEYVNWTDCLKKEIELIKQYGRIDLKTGILCNMTDGGEGCFNLSNESRLKISISNKGKKRSEEFKIKMSVCQKGKIHSQETKSKMSISHKLVDKTYLLNRKLSEETKLKISESKKGVSIGNGKILTESHKAAISNGFKPKFNNVDLKEIVEMYNNNISFRKIALKFKSNHTTIKKYIINEIQNL